MDLVTIEEVRGHCNVYGTYDDAALTRAADGAEQAAQDFLNRRVFATPEGLATALVELPALVEAAESARTEAREAAQALPGEASHVANLAACAQWDAAVRTARETAVGMVVNAAVHDAVLLIAGHLYRNREAVTAEAAKELPMGVDRLLWPHRVGLGV